MPTSRPFRVPCVALTAIAFASSLCSREATAQTAPAPAIEPQASGGLARANEAPGFAASAEVKTPRREAPLAQVGASLFALTYLASALVAATGYDSTSGTDTSRGALWIPGVGPFIMLGSVKAAGQGTLLVL